MLRLLLALAILQIPLTSHSQGVIEFRAHINETQPGRPLVSEVLDFTLDGNALRGSLFSPDPRISNVYISFPGADLYNFVKDPMGDWLLGASLWEEQREILVQGNAQALVIAVDGDPPLAYPISAPVFQVPEPAITTFALSGFAVWLLAAIRRSPLRRETESRH